MRTYWPQDGGPLYAETPLQLHDGQWLIEPWNAISSLLIVAPALYFIWRLWGNFRSNILLTLCIPLLVAGGLGSTLFHGLRLHGFFLAMDVLPTLLLFLLVTAYFWAEALRSWWAAVGMMLLSFGLMWVAHNYLPGGSLRVNVGYAIRGTMFFIPLIITLWKTQLRHGLLVAAALLAFGAALAFRLADKLVVDVLSMGSHFLWHACTGIGGFLIAEYIARQRADVGLSAATTTLQET